MLARRLPLLLVPALALVLAGCPREPSRAAGPPDWPGRNLLANPGFEEGRSGWSIRDESLHWGDFAVVEAPVHSGRRAAHLSLVHEANMPPRAVAVYGVVQELGPGPLPDVLGGFYRVERWEKSEPETDLYLQAVAIVWGGSRPSGTRSVASNFQLRSYLVGLEDVAFRLQNAKIHFFAKGPPRLSEWVRFEIPLREELESRWGAFPGDHDRISILFEARWDNMPGRNAVHADVYYDDLFVGYREER